MLRKQFASTPARINFFDRQREPAPSRNSSVREVHVEVPPSLQPGLSVEDKIRIRSELSQKITDLRSHLHFTRYAPLKGSSMLVTEAHHLVKEATDIKRLLSDGHCPDHIYSHADSTYIEARRMSAMIKVMMIALGER